ncbi:sigma-70 family RNA polymerase sigma factor [Nocardioides sp. DS6]|uniref:Sigma-70 family RNA polymerase sigma factor n=1 Tax=Nocardioides eburneus TaxID=3231482 RepID=A0ABV3T2R1_9ACTN
MTDPTLTPFSTIDEPGDAELISAVRAGDLEAYGTLFERHVEAARRLARQLASAGDVDDLVSEAFAKVLGVLQKGGGPDLAFRAYLLTSLRRLHVDKIRAGSRLTPTDDLTPYDPGVPFEDTAVAGFDNQAAAKAFAQLPERWQQVLWHTEVEGQKPAEIAPMLGMSPNSVSALAYRAREGLRQAFISMHAQDAVDDACARTRANLGAYIRGGLSKRDSAKVEAHLQDCRPCAAIYLELTEVNANLGALLAPLLLGSAGIGYLAAVGAGTKAGILLFLTGAKNWVLHNPVGRVAAGATGVAAAAVVAAAVAMGGGNPPTKPVAEPPASSAPAPTPAATSPQQTPKTTSPTHTSSAAPSATGPVTSPPPAPSSTPSDTTPATTPEQAPIIATPLPAVTATPGKSVVIDLTNGATDPNGDPLTVKSASVAKPSHGTVHKGGQQGRPVMPRLSGGKTGLSGSAPVLARPAGVTTVTYTPDRGWRGTDTIDYTLTDGHGGTVSGSVEVTTPNAPPVAESFTVRMRALDSRVSISPLAGHAADPNKHDKLTVIVVKGPKRGTASAKPDGRIVYTREASIDGYTTRIRYVAQDQLKGRSAPGTITIKVPGWSPHHPTPENHRPTATGAEGDPLVAPGDSVDIVVGGSDPDGDALSYEVPDHARNGGEIKLDHISKDGSSATLTYTAPQEFTGDSFSYRVTDGRRISDPKTVQVGLAPPTADVAVTPDPDLSYDRGGYMHLKLRADGLPAGAVGRVSVTVTGILGWWPGGSHSSACGEAPDPPPSTVTLECEVTGTGHQIDLLHFDLVPDPETGWSFTADLTPKTYVDPENGNNHVSGP